MATIKSYSDLQQSRKLAEILPLESADMVWVLANPDLPMIKAIAYQDSDKDNKYYEILPAWSLASLLDVLPIIDNRSPVIPKTFDGKYRVTYHSTAYERAIITSDYDNPIDACVAMIERLHELNLL